MLFAKYDSAWLTAYQQSLYRYTTVTFGKTPITVIVMPG